MQRAAAAGAAAAGAAAASGAAAADAAAADAATADATALQLHVSIIQNYFLHKSAFLGAEDSFHWKH